MRPRVVRPEERLPPGRHGGRALFFAATLVLLGLYLYERIPLFALVLGVPLVGIWYSVEHIRVTYLHGLARDWAEARHQWRMAHDPDYSRVVMEARVDQDHEQLLDELKARAAR